MAQGQQAAFTTALANRGYSVHDGAVLVGSAPPSGEGFILPIPSSAFRWFEQVPEDHRGWVGQAMVEYLQNRVAQPAAKKDGATYESVVAALNSAVTAGFKPSRERDKDIVESEVATRFAKHVAARVRASHPDASQATIDATIAKFVDPDGGGTAEQRKSGAEKLAELRREVLAGMRYTVTRKGAGEAASAVDIAI